MQGRFAWTVWHCTACPRTNALLLEKKLDLFEPSPYLFFSVHLDGLKEHHDKAVSQKGVFDRAVSAIKAAKAKGGKVTLVSPKPSTLEVLKISGFDKIIAIQA